MRNNRDFEQLIFERAEKIKEHDKTMKLIRMTVTPIAAAFVILTAVGIHRFAVTPANMSAQADNAPAFEASAAYAPENSETSEASTARQTIKSAEAEDQTDDAAYEDYEYDGMAANEAPVNAAPGDVTVTFTANDAITLTGSEALDAAEALADESTPVNSEDKGYLGTVTVKADGQSTDYRIYTDHVGKTENGEFKGSFTLDDSTKAVLSKYFPVKF